MYSVLIVDDEYYICEGMKRKLEKIALPEIGEIRSCLSGEEALELCRTYRPQIVITDIKMQGMNGIDLIQQLAKRLYPVQFLVLSGYDDFSYVRGAFQSGAADYLLKPLLTEDLLRMVKAACSKLKSLPVQEDPQRSDLFRLAERLLPPLASSVRPPAGTEEELSALFPFGTYRAAFFAFEKMQNQDERTLRANLIYDCFDNSPPLLCCPLRENQFVLLIGSGEEELVSDKLRSLLASPSFTAGQPAAASLSRPGTLTELPVLFQEAQQQLCCRLKERYGRLFGFDALPTVKAGLSQRIKHLISQDLQTPALCMMDSVRAELSREVRAMHLLDLFSFYDYFNDMIHLELINNHVTDPRLPPSIYDFNNYEELEAFLNTRLKEYASLLTEHPRPANLMEAVKTYIDQHFTESITLSDLADRFFVSYSHLSKSFHKTFHLSFSEYVLMLRMEYALELLARPELSIQDISALVGYDNLFNFSRAFKSHYGKSPSHFRKGEQEIR